MVSTASRFHRTVRKLARCKIGSEARVPDVYRLLLASKDTILGVYYGGAPDLDLVFTDRALLFTDLQSGCAERLRYADILEIEFPLPSSESVTLSLRVLDGSIKSFAVVGRDGNFRDVFEVGRYLMRVVEDRVRST